MPATPPTPWPGPGRRRRLAAGALAPTKRLELRLQAGGQLLHGLHLLQRLLQVALRLGAGLALGADRREPRLQALALRLHLGNLVLELLHLPLRRQLLVLSLLPGQLLLAERRAPARQPLPRGHPRLCASSAGPRGCSEAAPTRSSRQHRGLRSPTPPAQGVGVGVSGVEAGLAGQAVGR